MFTSTLILLSTFCAFSVHAAPVEVATTSLEQRSGYPFTRVVAFGDSLTDNGNGSYGHCLAAPKNCNNTIYGHRTWTNGPVAVSYLVDMLRVPLAYDYAYGGQDGGSKAGATIDTAYTYSGVPSSKDQIATYLASPDKANSRKTMYFLWIGQNDCNLKHIPTWHKNNTQFGVDMAAMMVEQVGSLISAGAPYVFVPAIYPRQISPAIKFFADSTATTDIFAEGIAGANAAIKSALVKKFGNKVIYYDVYNFMISVWNNHASYGITHVGGEYCDGYSQEDWNLCVTQHQGNTFYWMNFIDPTTYVHQLIAKDMHRVIKARFGASY